MSRLHPGTLGPHALESCGRGLNGIGSADDEPAAASASLLRSAESPPSSLSENGPNNVWPGLDGTALDQSDATSMTLADEFRATNGGRPAGDSVAAPGLCPRRP